jgi:hypothetical protein
LILLLLLLESLPASCNIRCQASQQNIQFRQLFQILLTLPGRIANRMKIASNPFLFDNLFIPFPV